MRRGRREWGSRGEKKELKKGKSPNKWEGHGNEGRKEGKLQKGVRGQNKKKYRKGREREEEDRMRREGENLSGQKRIGEGERKRRNGGMEKGKEIIKSGSKW